MQFIPLCIRKKFFLRVVFSNLVYRPFWWRALIMFTILSLLPTIFWVSLAFNLTHALRCLALQHWSISFLSQGKDRLSLVSPCWFLDWRPTWFYFLDFILDYREINCFYCLSNHYCSDRRFSFTPLRKVIFKLYIYCSTELFIFIILLIE